MIGKLWLDGALESSRVNFDQATSQWLFGLLQSEVELPSPAFSGASFMWKNRDD